MINRTTSTIFNNFNPRAAQHLCCSLPKLYKWIKIDCSFCRLNCTGSCTIYSFMVNHNNHVLRYLYHLYYDNNCLTPYVSVKPAEAGEELKRRTMITNTHIISSLLKYSNTSILISVFEYFLKYLYGILNTIFLKYFKYFGEVILTKFKYLYLNTMKKSFLSIFHKN